MSYVRKAKKRPYADRVNKFIRDFPDLLYDGAKIYCKLCEKALMCWDKRDCRNHVNTSQHRSRKQVLPSKTGFLFDLLFTMIACNLPLRLLDATPFRDFWNKYNPELKLPSARKARKHVPPLREEVERQIKSKLNNQRLWLCVDETTDCKKNYIVNVIVRVLDPCKPTYPLLLASKRLQDCTDATITRVVLDTLEHFQISTSQVLMFMSDGTKTMCKVGRSLQEHNWRFLHVTCKMHALRLVEEYIRKRFPGIDALITNTKKVFLKSPERIKTFHRQCPGIPEPPQPIPTEWGTWLKAVFYYSEYFQQIKAVVLLFNPDDTTAIKESQSKFQDISLETDVHTVHNTYKLLHEAIENLQDTVLPLGKSLKILDEVNTLLRDVSDAKTACVLEEFESVLNKDSDFITLREICDGTSTHSLSPFKDCFSYACITSVDVKRSLSQYKQVFSPKRTSFQETTVETYLMLSMFYKSYPNWREHLNFNTR
ncbi:hypothetical protein NQ318_015187 [Aromia moschata]|uniref:DUF659 domain-containing protein n=1 Tax=Aromia moschata TaxID=1265417 RepID=A0AAV8XKZ6_9CUCU|nr:hypothetical protein NQ318_015187 [Aromia moschata]